MEKKHPFFLDLEQQASSLLDGCLMQPQELTGALSGRRDNLLSKYSRLVIKVRMPFLRFLLTLSLPLQFFLQPFYPPVPIVSQTVSLFPYPFCSFSAYISLAI
ncbi:hypothetical protein ACPOM7_27305 [Peribacillus castrilensis]|uniref:hypothetical protein n=1 Tax=Bacillaceae TaxID=186817 RepID=UPI0011586C20|nr:MULTISPECIES: hypothetical protein [Bacillaceae]MCF7622037.1 hypothetical protein [Peribacillus frigoritolerans]MCP1156081.1 hypothetical protein [Peribacillus frigoritolerans]MCT1391252.1 hypothetical protein [Peribacillus frigoritolerans]